MLAMGEGRKLKNFQLLTIIASRDKSGNVATPPVARAATIPVLALGNAVDNRRFEWKLLLILIV
jgi:hypothetical protein